MRVAAHVRLLHDSILHCSDLVHTDCLKFAAGGPVAVLVVDAGIVA
jgi:hypothetical protein